MEDRKAVLLPEDLGPFPMGSPNTAYAQYFDGQSFLAPLADFGVQIANVTFEPGCRNHWHTHTAKSGGGQILLCTAGRGWYQAWGEAPKELYPGVVITIPAGVKHWHGAAKDNWMAHLSVAVPGDECGTEWQEPVSDEEYDRLP